MIFNFDSNEYLNIVIGNDYEHFSQSCVSEHNIVKYEDKSISECMSLCSARLDCLAFEYGVNHGGSGSIYKQKDCQLQSSADKSGCDGVYNNLDLYVKLGRRWCCKYIAIYLVM